MKKTLLEQLLNQDLRKSIELMIEPSRDFVGNTYEYNFDWTQEAIDQENLVIRTHKFMEQMLEFDDFTDFVNRFIYKLEKDNQENYFDYVIAEQLKELYDIEVSSQGYTYNDPDYCHLNRGIHYTVFEHDMEDYVILGVHYGADARAGFCDFACFRLIDYDYFFLGMDIWVTVDDGNSESLVHSDLEDFANYDKGKDMWVDKKTGEEVWLDSASEGF